MTAPATPVPTVNWVYWSLTYEVAFYLVVFLGLAERGPNGVIAGCLLLAFGVALASTVTDNRPWFFLPQFHLFGAGFFAAQPPPLAAAALLWRWRGALCPVPVRCR